VPHVLCPSCGLDSYAVTPHSRRSLCPYCDAELFATPRPAAVPVPSVPEADGAVATAAPVGGEDAGGGAVAAEAA
jgi:hypothetical protein